jgi:hypothetical protein
MISNKALAKMVGKLADAKGEPVAREFFQKWSAGFGDIPEDKLSAAAAELGAVHGIMVEREDVKAETLDVDAIWARWNARKAKPDFVPGRE